MLRNPLTHWHSLKDSAEPGQKQWGKFAVAEWAQKNLPIENLQNNLIEVQKYSSKIFTDPEGVKRKKGEKVNPIICDAAYHNIISAMKGRRVFDRFGFNLPPRQKQESKTQLLKNYKEWIFDSMVNDWVEIDGELTLSNYNPPRELTILLEKNINTNLK